MMFGLELKVLYHVMQSQINELIKYAITNDVNKYSITNDVITYAITNDVIK